MNSPRLLFFVVIIFVFSNSIEAQKRRVVPKSKNKINTAQKPKEVGGEAMIIDESLSVLRVKPSLFAGSIQRMRRGRRVKILESKQADGVTFYRVAAPPNNFGWVQSEAVFGGFRRGDDERLARLIQASGGFDQLELAVNFLELFPASSFRPAILLLFGDLAEETAVKLSRDATKRLDRREMAATGAPVHSFYLNFVSLDRYRKLGIVFLFDTKNKTFHYDGASWREIVRKFPNSTEAVEAGKRIDSLNAVFAETK
ncbi:MAG: SH3 domain-containing protein [Pyrinomonadaceae bacterium]